VGEQDIVAGINMVHQTHNALPEAGRFPTRKLARRRGPPHSGLALVVGMTLTM
jgi:hypothetical protein